MDNSLRNVCNRGRITPAGLDGVSAHAHDPATHRQRFRRPLRTIRRRHPDGQGPGAIAAIALPRGRAGRQRRGRRRGPGPDRRASATTRRAACSRPGPPRAAQARRRDHLRQTARVRHRRPGRGGQLERGPATVPGRRGVGIHSERAYPGAGDSGGRQARRRLAQGARRGGPARGETGHSRRDFS